MFDCWGPTINLAARMESSGQPNMVHISESVYRALSAVPNNPYEFSPPRVTYAKGFGSVRSWLLVKTKQPLPKHIVEVLDLEFTFREFWFGTRGGIRPQQQQVGLGLQDSAPDSSSQQAGSSAPVHNKDARSETSDGDAVGPLVP